MDIAVLFQRLLELSPFVAALFYFLITVWKSMNKKDEALTANLKEHSAHMLQMQRESITAQNNNAEATRLLSASLDKFRVDVCDAQEEVLREVRDLRVGKNNTIRRPPNSPSPQPSA